MANKQVNMILSLTDKMSQPLLRISDNVGKVSSDTKKAVASFNRGAKNVERKMDKLVKKSWKWTKALGMFAGGTAFTLGMKGTGELQDSANKVKSIAKEALELKEIQEGLLRVSTKLGSGITTKDVGDAQYQAISSGIDPADSLEFTELAGKLKVAGFTDIESAIDLLTSTMNAFNLSTIEEAVVLADEFLYTQNKGVILVDEMAQYYGQLTPFFSTMNLGTEDLNTAIATLTKMGVKPAEAVTSTKALMKDLSGATPKAIKEAANYGIELSAAALESRGFAGTMNEIIDATGGDVAKIMSIFPNVRSMIASLNLTSEQGVEIFKDVADGMKDSVGSVDEAYEILQNSLPKRLGSIKNALKNYLTKAFNEDTVSAPIMKRLKEIDDFLRSEEGWEKMGEVVKTTSEYITTLLGKIKEVVDVLIENREAIVSVIKSVLALYFATKAFKAVKKGLEKIKEFGKLFDGLFFGEATLGMLSKFLIAIGVILLAVRYFKNNWEELEEKFPTLMKFIGWVRDKLEVIIPWFLENIPKIIDGILTGLDTFLNIMSELLGAVIVTIGWVIEKIKAFVGFFVALFTGDSIAALEEFCNFFGIEMDWVMEKYDAVKEFLKPLKAEVEMLTGKFKKGYEYVTEKWNNLKNWFSKKLTATVEWKEDMKERGGGSVLKGIFTTPETVPQRATGDLNWKGGIVQVSEKGGEILDLPNGTRIYPHDDSVKKSFMDGLKLATSGNTSNNNISLPINIYGNVYGEKDLMDKVGNELVTVLEKHLPNMA